MKYILSNINKVDYVLTVSNGAADCLREYGYKKQIKVLRNGTDLVIPQNKEQLRNQIKEKYKLNDEIVFLSVGRIVENKKLSFAVEVMKELKNRKIKFKYLIVGAGPYENELKEKVKNEGLENEIIFTGKIMDRDLLAGHYLVADLFIFPSTFDTASLAPLEAASMFLPTIMTEGCSSAEIITDNQNGLLAKEGDVIDWANKIENCLKENKLSKLKQNANKEVYRTWDDVVKEVYDFYNKILKKKKI